MTTRSVLFALLFFWGQLVWLSHDPQRFEKIFWSIRPHFLNLNLRVGNTHQAWILEKMASVRQPSSEDSFSLFLLGGSTFREFFEPDQTLKEHLGMTVYNLAGSSQAIVDSMRMLKAVQNKGTVIYGLFPLKFLISEEGQMSAAKSMWGSAYIYPAYHSELDNLFASLGVKHQSFEHKIYPALNFFIGLLKVVRPATQANEPKQYFYTNNKPMGNAQFRTYLRYYQTAARKKSLREQLAYNLDLLEALREQSHQQGLKFCVFELPLNERLIADFEHELNVYLSIRNELKKDYCFYSYKENSVEKTFFSSDYFYDGGHLFPYGRQFFRDHALNGLKFAVANGK